MVKRHFISTFLLIQILCSCQTVDDKSTWTKDQIGYRETFLKFCNYVDNKQIGDLPLDTLFKNYIYFDYILKDTVTERKDRRLKMFPSIMQPFQHLIDSIGANNIDIKPISYYEKDTAFFLPFTKQLKEQIPWVMAYYQKGHEEKPLGTIMFSKKTHKITAWIIIDQGGFYYYETFNLL